MDILRQIKHLCEEKEITLSKLEQEVGLSPRTIYRWDINTPNINKLKLVADYFNVSVDYLIGDTDYPNRHDTEQLNRLLAYQDQIEKISNQPKLTEQEELCLQLFKQLSPMGKQAAMTVLSAMNMDKAPLSAQ